jgi:drug/metabolite transporter (DMT)-like permease
MKNYKELYETIEKKKKDGETVAKLIMGFIFALAGLLAFIASICLVIGVPVPQNHIAGVLGSGLVCIWLGFTLINKVGEKKGI